MGTRKNCASVGSMDADDNRIIWYKFSVNKIDNELPSIMYK